MDNAQTRSRRRETRDQSPGESSADDVAAGSDREETKRRRTSWSHQKNFTPQRASPNKRQYDESDSPGEVAGDADEYWHDSHSSSRRRSPSPIDRPTPIERNHEDRSPDESDALSEDRREREEHNHHSSRDDLSNRSSTPVPPTNANPPPPSKPESLNYKEKYVLKAHLRGVSTVQFSPDCSMIASGGMSFFPQLFMPQLLITSSQRLRRRHQGLGNSNRQTHIHIRRPSLRYLDIGLESGWRVDCIRV